MLRKASLDHSRNTPTMILWLLGISGSGKSTLGAILKTRLDEKGVPNVMVDGDGVREFFDSDLGYTRADRVANIKRILFGAYVLSQTDRIAIICNIHPFQELRDFARRKIRNYNEIYLCKNLQASVRRDVKTVYKKNMGKTDLVGVNIPFEEPTACDLKIDIDHLTVEQSLEELNRHLRQKYPSWPL